VNPWPGRASGVLLHPTSLPGPWGMGDLGPASRGFLRWLNRSGQKLWQMLPLTPVGATGSPYSSPSAFAMNPLLLSLDDLIEDGWLAPDAEGLEELRTGSAERVDFDVQLRVKEPLIRLAATSLLAARGSDRFPTGEYDAFLAAHTAWLPSWARFAAEKRARGGAPRWEWSGSTQATDADVAIETAVQFLGFQQIARLRAEASRLDIRLVGDLPIFVAEDSADVEGSPELFDLAEDGRPRVVAGVPPDAFSDRGQLWGNPMYRWDRATEQNYAWWTARVRTLLAVVDLIRVDHFRGFAGAWAVPRDAEDARSGQWVPGSGRGLFDALSGDLGGGRLPLIAEDLGVITPDVEELRDGLQLPGMKILQFAFDGTEQNPYLPRNHHERCVVYTGTHDNDTVLGWWDHAPQWSRDSMNRELGGDPGRDGVAWALIDLALRSPAELCITPVQDLLGLDGTARMNVPGVAFGNWAWRLDEGQLTSELADRLKAATEGHGR
jgi:4-alpha-glucanotransferase